MNLFKRNNQKNKRKQNLQYILDAMNKILKEASDVKIFHTKHTMLISTCIELSENLPLEEKRIVREIIDKCRY